MATGRPVAKTLIKNIVAMTWRKNDEEEKKPINIEFTE